MITFLLSKVVIESEKHAREYNTVLIEKDVAIKQDMLLDRSGSFLYAMTEKKVSLIPVNLLPAMNAAAITAMEIHPFMECHHGGI